MPLGILPLNDSKDLVSFLQALISLEILAVYHCHNSSHHSNTWLAGDVP